MLYVGPEARVQRVGAPRGQRRHGLRVEALGPLDHRVTFDVDSPASGAAGQLGVLPRGDGHPCFAVELLELLEHDGARRHVDAEGERLGREHDLDQLAQEQLLDDLFERGQQAGVVRCDASLEVVEPVVVAEHREVFVEQGAGALLDDRSYLDALLVRCQPHAAAPDLLHGGIAADPAEDEEDRGQKVRPGQQLDHVGAVETLDALHVRRAHRPLAALVRAATRRLVAAVARTAHRLRLAVAVEVRSLERPDAHELLVHLRRGDAGSVVEQRQQVAAHQDVLLERHRADLGHDHLGVATDRVEPVAELLGVGHRRRERDQTYALRQVDDDLLPHRPAEAIGEVVHLVHHDVAEAPQRGRVGVEHVAKHLGGHHHDPRVAVDVRVAGEKAHLVGAVHLLQLAELLIRQRLDGRRVERLVARLAHREMDGELADDRLAGARGRCDQDASTLFECAASRQLEGVERESLGCRERGRDRMPPVAARRPRARARSVPRDSADSRGRLGRLSGEQRLLCLAPCGGRTASTVRLPRRRGRPGCRRA